MSRITFPPPEVAGLPTPVLSHRVGVAGLCADSNSNKWFPPEPGPGSPVEEHLAFAQYARAACLGCTVVLECRELALRIEAHRPSHGVWGALAPWERDVLRWLRRAQGRQAVRAVTS